MYIQSSKITDSALQWVFATLDNQTMKSLPGAMQTEAIPKGNSDLKKNTKLEHRNVHPQSGYT